MAAITTRRKSTSDGDRIAELEARLAAMEAENAELRADIKALAALAVGIGYTRRPEATVQPRGILDICRINSVHGEYAERIKRLFPGG